MSKPTREEILKYVIDVIDGKIINPLHPGLVYSQLKESHGKNRSPEIDKLILKQGGALGESWCMYFCQSILDVIELRFDCKIDLPEGGSTQKFYNTTKEQYKHYLAKPLTIVIWKKYADPSLGHAALCLSYFDEHKEFRTFEGNTQNDTKELKRNGDGAYYRTRELEYPNMHLRGFVDIYEAIKFK